MKQAFYGRMDEAKFPMNPITIGSGPQAFLPEDMYYSGRINWREVDT
jgi:hypothetical protein